MSDAVVFDFCGTLADFQTFDPFMAYAIGNAYPRKKWLINNRFFRFCCFVLTVLIEKLTGQSTFLYKHFLVKLAKGIRLDVLQEDAKAYYSQSIQPHLIEPAISLLRTYQQRGDTIIILSAGLDLYIQEFAKQYGIKHVIANALEFENGVCTGRLANSECAGVNKVAMLQHYLEENQMSCRLAVAVSDNKSDMPVFNACEKGIAISRNKHQEWVAADMQEIIWRKSRHEVIERN